MLSISRNCTEPIKFSSMELFKTLMYYKERVWPFVCACLVSFVFHRYQLLISAKLPDVIDKLLNASLAVNGAILGFLLTILTIINTIASRRMKFIKTGGGFQDLLWYLKLALWANMVCITLFFSYPILSSVASVAHWMPFAYTLIVGILAYAWFLNIRFSFIFIKLLTDPHPEN